MGRIGEAAALLSRADACAWVGGHDLTEQSCLDAQPADLMGNGKGRPLSSKDGQRDRRSGDQSDSLHGCPPPFIFYQNRLFVRGIL